jgi:CheY-like chemotaxis protein
VVADLSLADGRSGLAEARALLAGLAASAPVLLVTGETAPGRLAEVARSGLPCLTKPVSPARLRHWLEGAAHPGAGAATGLPPAQPE